MEANRPDRLRNNLILLADGTMDLQGIDSASAITNEGRLLKCVKSGSMSAAVSKNLFKIQTKNETGSTDGGIYVCNFSGAVTHSGGSGSGTSAAKGFSGSFTHVIDDSGNQANNTLTYAIDITSAADAAGSRDVGVVLITLTANGLVGAYYDNTVAMSADFIGSAITTGTAITTVELVWSGFLTQPLITEL